MGIIHSVEVKGEEVLIVFREFLMASQTIQTSKITEVKEIRDPTEETTFHEVKASG